MHQYPGSFRDSFILVYNLVIVLVITLCITAYLDESQSYIHLLSCEMRVD